MTDTCNFDACNYPANIARDEDGRFVVTFPDFGWGATDGATRDEAMLNARALLRELIATTMREGKDLPQPSPAASGQPIIAPPAPIARKAAFYQAFRAAGVSERSFARDLGVAERVVQRMLNPDHATNPATIERAFRRLETHRCMDLIEVARIPEDPAVDVGLPLARSTARYMRSEFVARQSLGFERMDFVEQRPRDLHRMEETTDRMSGFLCEAPAGLAAFSPHSRASLHASQRRSRPVPPAGEDLWIIVAHEPEASGAQTEETDDPGSGALMARRPSGGDNGEDQSRVPLPLKHTEYQAGVTGYVGTVDVTQQFENPFDEKIEAVYLFPLPERAAVSEFLMTIGERRIRGILREKDEAEAIYREARARGYRASLLTQHRPNIFEQKVANIEPGKRIDVNIRYFHTLAYHDGWYTFVLPTVIGPRYNPPDSPDPVQALPRSHVQPVSRGVGVRYLRPDERSGHDIGITVQLDAGVAIEEIASSHRIVQTGTSPDAATITLAGQATIPNRDFVLKFKVAGGQLKKNFLTYVDPEQGEGYFTLALYPPEHFEGAPRHPMEMVFVLDCSGSMSGDPMEQSKAAVLEALDLLEPEDTFQIIRFSNDASQFGPDPVPASPNNIALAKRHVRELQANGGTEVLQGLRAALLFPHDRRRLRFVTFLTDGLIGNEVEVLETIHRSIGESRIFSFGVGSSVNRYLLNRMAKAGRGAAAYLVENDSGAEVMRYFFERISRPVLTDVEIDWGAMDVTDTYPAELPDLFVGRAVVVTGKFLGKPGAPVVRGRAGGQAVAYAVPPADGGCKDSSTSRAFIPGVWARLRIADLEDRQAWARDPREDLAGAIKATALAHGLVSAYTAFVAVDESGRTEGKHGTTVHQAVPVPAGVRYHTTVSDERMRREE